MTATLNDQARRYRSYMDLLESLFKRGLGQLPAYFVRANGAFIGHLVYEKDHLVFKDRGFLGEFTPEGNELWWQRKLLGMVCYRSLLAWESLTFYGVDNSRLPQELDEAHYASLRAARTTHGDMASSLAGSIYRAYQGLLEHGFLPVVLLHQTTSAQGDQGLAVADLRGLNLPAPLQERIGAAIKAAVTNRLTVLLDEGMELE